MRVARLVLDQIPQNLRTLGWMAAWSALASTTIMGLVDAAAEQAAKGQISLRLSSLFVVSVALFAVTDNYVLVTASRDSETIIHRLRTRLFDAVRAADLVTVEHIGRTRLYSALTQDTQTIARCLPFLVIGAQQAIMLIFLGAYLAWLSPVACLMAFGFAGAAVAIRYARMKSLGQAMRSATAAEMKVLDTLADMLAGFKEVRMSVLRATGLLSDLAGASAQAREIKSRTKQQWGWEFALQQSLFYALIGLMVFLVPLFAKGYAAVVIPATMATLFIVGPVGTIAHVTPMLTETDLALANIDAVQAELDRAVLTVTGESARPLAAPSRIALDGGLFSYADEQGRPIFSVGPLNLSFRAGEITFVTGGNGSGKSTMLRVLTGLAPLSAGDIRADGVAVEQSQMQAYRDHFSVVFSDYHLSRRIYGVTDIDPVRVDALLATLEMTGKVHVTDGAFSTIALSTGQRKRLALLVAELEDKPILVFDEWAADQDPHFRRTFYERLLPAFRARGKIIICVTHDDRWFGMADRIYHMHDGQAAEMDRQADAHVPSQV